MRLQKIYAGAIASVLIMMLASGCSKTQLGMARSDGEIASEVQARINSDSTLQRQPIEVNASNGVVTLAGTVDSETARLVAANDAAQVAGVKTVVNNLQVATAASEPIPAPVEQPRASRRAAPRRAARNEPANASTPEPARAPAQAAPVVRATPPPPEPITIPDGITLSVRTNDAIDTERAQPGDVFSATLDSPIYVDDQIAVPENAEIRGRVVDVKSAGKFQGRSELVLELTNLAFGGKSYRITTDHWQRTGASRGKNTAAKVGGGAALGAIIGGIAGGGKGAAIGAGVGAGAGTGVQAVTKGQQIVVSPETLLTFNLRTPVTVTPSRDNSRSGRTRLDDQ